MKHDVEVLGRPKLEPGLRHGKRRSSPTNQHVLIVIPGEVPTEDIKSLHHGNLSRSSSTAC